MSESYLVIDGKRIELTPEQISVFDGNKSNPFKRAKQDGKYYYLNCFGDVIEGKDRYGGFADYAYDCANYCTDQTMMEHRAAIELLSRQLWRASKLDGSQSDECAAYTIIADFGEQIFDVDHTYDIADATSAVFHSEATARVALEEIALPWLEKNPWFFEEMH